jgi:hypothetical protein
MADSGLEFTLGQTDYIAELNDFVTFAETWATETEVARGGESTLDDRLDTIETDFTALDPTNSPTALYVMSRNSGNTANVWVEISGAGTDTYEVKMNSSDTSGFIEDKIDTSLTVTGGTTLGVADKVVQNDATNELTVGYTTTIETVTYASTMAPNLATQWRKQMTVTGNFTLDQAVNGYGSCEIYLTGSGGPWTITAGTGVKVVGSLTTVADTKTYLLQVRKIATVTVVSMVEAI